MKPGVLICLTLTVLGVWADILSSNQKAPVYASGAGGLALPPPKSSGPAAAPSEDGVVREEMETFKTEGEHFIRVVTGKVGYTSPEGLAVSIKYMADENGNRASFTIGNPSGGSGGSGGGSGSRPGGGSGSRPGGGSGGGPSKGASGGKGDSYLPPNKNGKPGGGSGGGGGRGGGGGGGSGGGGGGGKMYLPPAKG